MCDTVLWTKNKVLNNFLSTYHLESFNWALRHHRQTHLKAYCYVK